MSQYDAVLGYASRAACLADHVVQQHLDIIQNFFMDHVIPDIKVWRASQDILGTDSQGNPTVTHNYLSGYFVLISAPRLILALRDDPALRVVIDRELANASLPGAIIRTTLSNLVLQDIRFEPVFAGTEYPWGNWQ